MGPKKKKGKLTKKELLRRKKEEQLLREERERQEEEEKQRLKEEQLKRDEEERIKACVAAKREEQRLELFDLIQKVSDFNEKCRCKEWEDKRWNTFLYETKKVDPLKLPNINTYITDWEDCENSDIHEIFSKIKETLEIIETIKISEFKYPNVGAKTLGQWNEGISNLQDIIDKKLNYATFMLLKDANMYVNDKTMNMEFMEHCDSNGSNLITLCSWANLHKTKKQQNLNMLDFTFVLPLSVGEEDCAVRLLYLSFNHIRTEKSIDNPSDKKLESEKAQIDVNKLEKQQSLKTQEEKTDEALINEEVLVKNKASHHSSTETTINEISNSIQKNMPVERKNEDNYSSSVKKEPHYVDERKDFLLGGIIHFNLLTIPKLTVRQNGLTYIFRENPVLKHIPYKQNVDLKNYSESDTSMIEIQEKHLETYEENELEDNSADDEQISPSCKLENVILLQMKLPEKVIYWEIPQPARFCLETHKFTTDGIYDIEYAFGSKELSFKVDQFGTFGLFQKKYLNFPYKNWHFHGGETAELFLEGQFYSISIKISNLGYQVSSLEPDIESVLSELKNSWMCGEELIQKLLAKGINIKADNDTNKFIGLSSKNENIEFSIYNCLALLSAKCDFSWSQWNHFMSAEEFVLKYHFISSEDDYTLALITPNQAVDLKSDTVKPSFENVNEPDLFSNNLFHLVLSKSSTKMQCADTNNFKLVENVLTLMRHCKCLSCA